MMSYICVCVCLFVCLCIVWYELSNSCLISCLIIFLNCTFSVLMLCKYIWPDWVLTKWGKIYFVLCSRFSLQNKGDVIPSCKVTTRCSVITQHIQNSIITCLIMCISCAVFAEGRVRGRRGPSTRSPPPERGSAPTARPRRPAGSVAMPTGGRRPAPRLHHRRGRSHSHRWGQVLYQRPQEQIWHWNDK